MLDNGTPHSSASTGSETAPDSAPDSASTSTQSDASTQQLAQASTDAVVLTAPAAGETAVTVDPGVVYRVADGAAITGIAQEGGDLVVTFDNGGTIRLVDYLVFTADEAIPSPALQVPEALMQTGQAEVGQPVVTIDAAYLAGIGVDLEAGLAAAGTPAAGTPLAPPGAGGAGGGGAGFNLYSIGAIGQGINPLDLLGDLNFGFAGRAAVEQFEAPEPGVSPLLAPDLAEGTLSVSFVTAQTDVDVPDENDLPEDFNESGDGDPDDEDGDYEPTWVEGRFAGIFEDSMPNADEGWYVKAYGRLVVELDPVDNETFLPGSNLGIAPAAAFFADDQADYPTAAQFTSGDGEINLDEIRNGNGSPGDADYIAPYDGWLMVIGEPGTDGAKLVVPNGDGEFLVSVDDINNIYLIPPTHGDADVPFTVAAQIFDPDSGDTAVVSGEGTAILDAVADKAEFGRSPEYYSTGEQPEPNEQDEPNGDGGQTPFGKKISLENPYQDYNGDGLIGGVDYDNGDPDFTFYRREDNSTSNNGYGDSVSVTNAVQIAPDGDGGDNGQSDVPSICNNWVDGVSSYAIGFATQTPDQDGSESITQVRLDFTDLTNDISFDEPSQKPITDMKAVGDGSGDDTGGGDTGGDDTGGDGSDETPEPSYLRMYRLEDGGQDGDPSFVPTATKVGLGSMPPAMPVKNGGETFGHGRVQDGDTVLLQAFVDDGTGADPYWTWIQATATGEGTGDGAVVFTDFTLFTQVNGGDKSLDPEWSELTIADGLRVFEIDFTNQSVGRDDNFNSNAQDAVTPIGTPIGPYGYPGLEMDLPQHLDDDFNFQATVTTEDFATDADLTDANNVAISQADFHVDIKAIADEPTITISDDDNGPEGNKHADTYFVPADEEAGTNARYEVDEDGTGYVVTETFSEGWESSGDDDDTNVEIINGALVLGKDVTGSHTATKTFDFGAEMAGQTVVIRFDTDTPDYGTTKGDWDPSGDYQDYFRVSVNGDKKTESSKEGEDSHKLRVKLDDQGQVELTFEADTTGKGEGVAISDLTVTAPRVQLINVPTVDVDFPDQDGSETHVVVLKLTAEPGEGYTPVGGSTFAPSVSPDGAFPDGSLFPDESFDPTTEDRGLTLGYRDASGQFHALNAIPLGNGLYAFHDGLPDAFLGLDLGDYQDTAADYVNGLEDFSDLAAMDLVVLGPKNWYGSIDVDVVGAAIETGPDNDVPTEFWPTLLNQALGDDLPDADDIAFGGLMECSHTSFTIDVDATPDKFDGGPEDVTVDDAALDIDEDDGTGTTEAGNTDPTVSATGKLNMEFGDDYEPTFVINLNHLNNQVNNTQNPWTSEGRPLQAFLGDESGNNDEGHIVTVFAMNGVGSQIEPVLKIAIDPTSGPDFTYTVTQLDNIDHGPDDSDTDLLKSLNVRFIATDDADHTSDNVDGDSMSNADSINGKFTITLTDDAPIAHDSAPLLMASERWMDEHGTSSVDGVLTFVEGADGAEVTGITYTGAAGVIEADETAADNEIPELTSGGKTVEFGVTAPTSGQPYFQVTGTVDSGTTPVFTLKVWPDGQYTFTLEGQLDHPDEGDVSIFDQIKLGFEYEVTDGDGDTDTATLTVRVTDDGPVDVHDSYNWYQEDESAFGTGLVGQCSGTLTFDVGADEPGGVSAVGSPDGDQGFLVGSLFVNQGDWAIAANGQPVAVTVTEANGDIVVNGTIDDGDTPVFTLTVTKTTGAYTFDQMVAFDHPEDDKTGKADVVELTFGYTVSDYDGDTATGKLNIRVADDGPSITGTSVSYVEDETEFGNDPDGTPLVGKASGDLSVVFGADDGSNAADYDGTIDGDDTDTETWSSTEWSWSSWSFVTVQHSQEVDRPVDLTSNGVAVTFGPSVKDSNGVTTLTGTAGDAEVLKLVIQPDGTFNFYQYAQIDHPDAGETGADDPIDLTFKVTVTDGDNDTASADLTVTIGDDGPVAVADATVSGEVYEADLDTALSTGTADADEAVDNTGVSTTLNLSALVDGGLDQPLTYSLVEGGGLPTLSSKGDAISYSIDGNGALVGTADGRTVLMLEMVDGSGTAVASNETGQAKFTLFDQIDHPDVDNPQSMTLDLASAVKVTDFDGDSITLNSGLEIAVHDDGPTSTFENLEATWGFESPDPSGWGVFQTVSDGGSDVSDGGDTEWTATDGTGIEIQEGNVGGLGASDGGENKVELDSDPSRGGDGSASTTNSTMSRTIDMNGFGALRIQVDYSPRLANKPEDGDGHTTNAIEVLWNGAVIGTLDATEKGWNTYTFLAEGADANGEGELAFRAVGADDSYGGFLDNVQVNGVVGVARESELDGNGVSVSGDFGFVSGADEEISITDLHLTVTDPEGDGFGPFTLNANGSLTNTDGDSLQSAGEDITVSRSDDTWTGTAGGREVFTIEIDPEDGTFDVTFHAQIDHPDAPDQTGPADPLSFNLAATIEDFDGDSHTTQTASVLYLDDGPAVGEAPQTLLVTNFDTEAGWNNSFGFYVLNDEEVPETGKVIWANASNANLGQTVAITGLNPETTGFFIIPNGAGKNRGLENGNDVTFEPVDANDPSQGFNAKLGDVVLETQEGSPIFFDNQDWNPPNENYNGIYSVKGAPGDSNEDYIPADAFGVKMYWDDGGGASGDDNDYSDVEVVYHWVDAVVDEDALTDGNPAGPEDVDPTNATFTGVLNLDYGADGPADGSGVKADGGANAFAFTMLTLGGTEYSISSDGAVTGLALADGTPLYAYAIPTDNAGTLGGVKFGTAENEPALTITVTDNGETWAGSGSHAGRYTYEVELLKPLQHEDNAEADTPNVEDDLLLSLGYRITDGDGDTADGSMTVLVDDDTPVAHDDVAGCIVEGTAGALTGNVITGDDASGADVGANGGANRGLTADDVGADQPGSVVSFTYTDANGATHTATVPDSGSKTVDTMYGSLQMWSNGDYEYTPTDSVDHAKSIGKEGTGSMEAAWDTSGTLVGVQAFDFGAFDAANPGTFDPTGSYSGNITYNSKGLGVENTSTNHGNDAVPEQINHGLEDDDTQGLVVDLGENAKSASFKVSNLFETEAGGEQGHWYAYDADGTLVGNDSFVLPDGTNVGTVQISENDVDQKDFQYLVFTAEEYDDNGSRTNDSSDYFLRKIDYEVSGTESVTYTMSDADGDESTATLTFCVKDGDGPTVTSTTPLALTVDEAEITDTEDGVVTFNAGSDDIVSIAFADPSGNAPTVSGLDNAASIVWSLSGGNVVGEIDGTTVLTLSHDGTTVSAQGSAGVSVTATLNAAWAHENDANVDDLTVTGVQLIGTDTDGDTATATVDVTVVDDEPEALDDYTHANTLLDNDSSVDVALTTLFDMGADGLSDTVDPVISPASTGLSYNSGTKQFTFDPSVGEGTYTYDVTVTDGDGDTATETLTFEVKASNQPPVAGSASGEGVQDAADIPVNFTGDSDDGTVTGYKIIDLGTAGANGTFYYNDGSVDQSVGVGDVVPVGVQLMYSPNEDVDTDSLDETGGPYSDDTPLTFTYQAVDDDWAVSNNTATGYITVHDVGPTANPDEATFVAGTQTGKVNLILTLDMSGSMDYWVDTDGDGNNDTPRLRATLDAMKGLLNAYGDDGVNNVMLTTFNSTGSAVDGGAWMTRDQALDWIDGIGSFDGDDGTDYDDAIAAVKSAYNANSEPSGADSTVMYFLSDGEPDGYDDVVIDASERDIWTTFLQGSQIDEVFAVGIGSGISDTTHLETVAWSRTGTDADNVRVSQDSDITGTLLDLKTSLPVNISGLNIVNNDQAGGDNWGSVVVTQVELAGTTYTDTNSDGTIVVPLSEGNVSIQTGQSGTTAGEVTGALNITADKTYVLNYTVQDSDSTTAASSLTMHLQLSGAAPVANDDHIITNIDATTVTVPEAALLANDTDADGDNLTATPTTFSIPENEFTGIGVLDISDSASSATADRDRFAWVAAAGGVPAHAKLNVTGFIDYGSKDDIGDTDTVSVDVRPGETLEVVSTDSGFYGVFIDDRLSNTYTNAGDRIETVQVKITNDYGPYQSDAEEDYNVTFKLSGAPEYTVTDETGETDQAAVTVDHQDTVDRSTGKDVLNGTPDDDILVADDSGVIMNGEGGDDILIGGAGADIMTGGDGDDVFVVGEGDTITDFTFVTGGEQDVIDLDALFDALEPGADADTFEVDVQSSTNPANDFTVTVTDQGNKFKSFEVNVEYGLTQQELEDLIAAQNGVKDTPEV
jgi:T1SS-143 domain-containing protein